LSSRWLRGVFSFALALAVLPGVVPVAMAAETLTLTTPYPAVVVSPDSRVTFNLSVKTSTAARVDLSTSGVPSSWTAALRGGGYTVGAVQTDGTEATEVRLDVDVPADATGSATIVVKAAGLGLTTELTLDIRVEAEAGGDITVQADFPALRGSTDQTFSFNLTISNETAEDLTYTATGQGPAGWTVEAKPTGQSQAVSGIAKAGGTAAISVTVEPAANAAAGEYPIQIVATVGTKQITQDLAVEITGSYTLTLSTPTEVLTAHGSAGGVTQQVFRITNTGTAPVTNVKLTASAPTSWKVDFDKASVDSIPAGEFADVTASITPSGDAIAGDYSITFNATADEAARASEQLRFTVEASIIGAIIGLALILLAVGGLWWVFRRYGRR
jgi:uncharacterized membrane protein